MSVNELYAQFHEIASSPRKQLDKYLSEGKKVVAVAPVYTPQEIIHSMGLVPMGVWGTDTVIDAAKQYFPAFICAVMQTILELGINGSYKGVSAIVIPSLCDSLKTLGQNWKYAVKDIPFIPMTYPQNRKPGYGVKFTKGSYQRVIDDLEKVTGAKFDDEALKNSIKVYNEHNAVMREFEMLASVKTISMAQRSDVFKSAWFMLPEEHTALVKELNKELSSTTDDTTEKRVLLSGILADAPELIKAVDDAGLKVAWDDIAAESRQYITDTPDCGSGLDSLAQKFSDMDNCSVLYDKDKKRVDNIIALAKEHAAKAVIVLMTKFCDPEEFDYVPIKDACVSAGIDHVLIEVDRQMVNYQQAGTMIQAFGEML